MTPEEEKVFIEMGQKFKNTFKSAEGQKVLMHIVWNILGTFRTDNETEGDISRSNAGVEILNYVSCSDATLTAKTIVRAVLDTPSITIKEVK